MATKRAVPAKSSSTKEAPKKSTVLQGVALIDAVIEQVQQQGFDIFAAWQKRLKPKKPVPLKSAAKAPPSLARWLSFHNTFQGIDFSAVDWKGCEWPELLDEAIGPMARFLFEDKNPPIAGPAIKLDLLGDFEVHAMIAGEPDDIGELPIVQVYANQPGRSSIGLYQPGFDAYIASWLKPDVARKIGVDLAAKPFAARSKQHAALSLGGKARYKL